MKTPICIVSFNRSFYLSSLLHSLADELNDFDVIVVDNGSTETNMQSVLNAWRNKITLLQLQGGDWINDEYKAKNAFIKHCDDTYKDAKNYIFLQDDMQYVGPRGHLKSIIDELSTSGFLNVSFTGVRRSTLEAQLSNIYSHNAWKLRDNHFNTTGLYKKHVFDTVGPYTQDYPITKEFWGRGEDDYNTRTLNEYGPSALISGMAHVPVFIGVWNDPRGHYSFIRDNKRYGHYLPPVQPHSTYYEHMSYETYLGLGVTKKPAGYVEIANPLGWSYAKENGDQKKYSQAAILLEGPVTDIT